MIVISFIYVLTINVRLINQKYVLKVSLSLSLSLSLSRRLAKRKDSIGFFACHRFCKHPQSQLVRVYQRFIYKFPNTFPLNLILSSMV